MAGNFCANIVFATYNDCVPAVGLRFDDLLQERRRGRHDARLVEYRPSTRRAGLN